MEAPVLGCSLTSLRDLIDRTLSEVRLAAGKQRREPRCARSSMTGCRGDPLLGAATHLIHRGARRPHVGRSRGPAADHVGGDEHLFTTPSRTRPPAELWCSGRRPAASDCSSRSKTNAGASGEHTRFVSTLRRSPWHQSFRSWPRPLDRSKAVRAHGGDILIRRSMSSTGKVAGRVALHCHGPLVISAGRTASLRRQYGGR